MENGTLCLNEIADADLKLQVKLLEVLETRRIRRLGENKKRSVNFRLIAASNRDLEQLMSEGRFRRDLYHRLKQIQTSLPPLRERTEDIPALVKHFLSECEPAVRNTPENAPHVDRLGAILSVHEYPGNVRELKARVSKLALSIGDDIAEMLRIAIDDGPLSKRELLARILDLTNWDRSRVAQIFDVSEGTIRNWIRKYRITRADLQ